MIWILKSLLASALAATVLIAAPQSHVLDYRAALKAHPEYISPTESYLAAHPSLESREKLLARFSDAQKSFLENSTDEARARFNEVVSLVLEDDWQRSDREIFLQAYLRLAQIETVPELRDRWLALSLHMSDADFDKSLYPPPLLTRRSELEAQAPKKDIAQRLRAQGWNEILIDGAPCPKAVCANWPLTPAPVRLTVLSDQWLPQTRVMDVLEAERWIPATTPWVTGTCRFEQFHSSAESFALKKVFWSLSCEKPGATAVDLFPLAAVAPAPPLSTDVARETREPNKHFYQSTWFWAGVGVVAAVVAVSAAAQHHDTAQPTTTYGY